MEVDGASDNEDFPEESVSASVHPSEVENNDNESNQNTGTIISSDNSRLVETLSNTAINDGLDEYIPTVPPRILDNSRLVDSLSNTAINDGLDEFIPTVRPMISDNSRLVESLSNTAINDGLDEYISTVRPMISDNSRLVESLSNTAINDGLDEYIPTVRPRISNNSRLVVTLSNTAINDGLDKYIPTVRPRISSRSNLVESLSNTAINKGLDEFIPTVKPKPSTSRSRLTSQELTNTGINKGLDVYIPTDKSKLYHISSSSSRESLFSSNDESSRKQLKEDVSVNLNVQSISPKRSQGSISKTNKTYLHFSTPYRGPDTTGPNFNLSPIPVEGSAVSGTGTNHLQKTIQHQKDLSTKSFSKRVEGYDTPESSASETPQNFNVRNKEKMKRRRSGLSTQSSQASTTSTRSGTSSWASHFTKNNKNIQNAAHVSKGDIPVKLTRQETSVQSTKMSSASETPHEDIERNQEKVGRSGISTQSSQASKVSARSGANSASRSTNNSKHIRNFDDVQQSENSGSSEEENPVKRTRHETSALSVKSPSIVQLQGASATEKTLFGRRDRTNESRKVSSNVQSSAPIIEYFHRTSTQSTKMSNASETPHEDIERNQEKVGRSGISTQSSQASKVSTRSGPSLASRSTNNSKHIADVQQSENSGSPEEESPVKRTRHETSVRSVKSPSMVQIQGASATKKTFSGRRDRTNESRKVSSNVQSSPPIIEYFHQTSTQSTKMSSASETPHEDIERNQEKVGRSGISTQSSQASNVSTRSGANSASRSTNNSAHVQQSESSGSSEEESPVKRTRHETSARSVKSPSMVQLQGASATDKTLFGRRDRTNESRKVSSNVQSSPPISEYFHQTSTQSTKTRSASETPQKDIGRNQEKVGRSGISTQSSQASKVSARSGANSASRSTNNSAHVQQSESSGSSEEESPVKRTRHETSVRSVKSPSIVQLQGASATEKTLSGRRDRTNESRKVSSNIQSSPPISEYFHQTSTQSTKTRSASETPQKDIGRNQEKVGRSRISTQSSQASKVSARSGANSASRSTNNSAHVQQSESSGSSEEESPVKRIRHETAVRSVKSPSIVQLQGASATEKTLSGRRDRTNESRKDSSNVRNKTSIIDRLNTLNQVTKMSNNAEELDSEDESASSEEENPKASGITPNLIRKRNTNKARGLPKYKAPAHQAEVNKLTQEIEKLMNHKKMISRSTVRDYLDIIGMRPHSHRMKRVYEGVLKYMEIFFDRLCRKASRPHSMYTFKEFEAALKDEGLVGDERYELMCEIFLMFKKDHLEKIRGILIPKKGAEDTADW